MELKNIMIVAVVAILIVAAGLYASGIFTGGNSAKGNLTVLAGAGTKLAMDDLKANYEEKIPELPSTYSMVTVENYLPR